MEWDNRLAILRVVAVKLQVVGVVVGVVAMMQTAKQIEWIFEYNYITNPRNAIISTPTVCVCNLMQRFLNQYNSGWKVVEHIISSKCIMQILLDLDCCK